MLVAFLGFSWASFHSFCGSSFSELIGSRVFNFICEEEEEEEKKSVDFSVKVCDKIFELEQERFCCQVVMFIYKFNSSVKAKSQFL